MSVESGPGFLQDKYDLHNAAEVDSAADRTEHRTGDVLPNDPTTRIENYLDRFDEIFNRDDPAKRERGIDALKQVLNEKLVIKPENISDSYWEAQKRIIRERGQGDHEFTDQEKAQQTEVIIADQISSLNKWIDYLASDDATYPTWLKYYAMRGISGMGGYDKGKQEFAKRSKGTTKPFPDLDREALAYVLDVVSKHYSEAGVNLSELNESDGQQLTKILDGANFAKLYAWAIEKATPAEENELLTTQGDWVKYEQSSDHMPLVKSLQGHGTGWCTAGEHTAHTQLGKGDFYVYYSQDKNGQATVPRVAIRMEGDSIAEVRGIAQGQELDPYMFDVVREKMTEFPDGAAYEKKAYDMQMVTYIEQKVKAGEELTRDDLTFLYEVDSLISTFGYGPDPRVRELRSNLDMERDMPVIFNCRPEQIAHSMLEVDSETKAYVGPLEPGIFQKIPEDLEYFYTDFPYCRIERSKVMVGEKTQPQVMAELEAKGVEGISNPYTNHLLTNMEYPSDELPQPIHLAKVSFSSIAPYSLSLYGLFRAASQYGLEPCPHGAALEQILKEAGNQQGESYVVGMIPVPNLNAINKGMVGHPEIIRVEHEVGKTSIRTVYSRSDDDGRWDEPARFLLRVTPPTQPSEQLTDAT